MYIVDEDIQTKLESLHPTIAKNMLQEVFHLDIIMKVTGLSQEVIERLN